MSILGVSIADLLEQRRIKLAALRKENRNLHSRLAEAVKFGAALALRNHENLCAREDAEQRVAELEKALRHIGEFAEAHHAEQPISALLHSLTVDIPHYVAVSLSPSTTQGTRDAG